MGMFDWVKVEASFVDQIVCFQGHPLKELQTKHFEQMLWTYTIKDDGLYVQKDGDCETPSNLPGERIDYFGSIKFYGNCQHQDCCIKIKNKYDKRDIIHLKGPYNCFIILMDNDKILGPRVVRRDTKQDILNKYSIEQRFLILPS